MLSHVCESKNLQRESLQKGRKDNMNIMNLKTPRKLRESSQFRWRVMSIHGLPADLISPAFMVWTYISELCVWTSLTPLSRSRVGYGRPPWWVILSWTTKRPSSGGYQTFQRLQMNASSVYGGVLKMGNSKIIQCSASRLSRCDPAPVGRVHLQRIPPFGGTRPGKLTVCELENHHV